MQLFETVIRTILVSCFLSNGCELVKEVLAAFIYMEI